MVLVLCLLRWEVLVFAWLEVLVEALKESDYTENTPAHLARQGILGVQFRPKVWKRLRSSLGSDPGPPGAKFLKVHQETVGHDPGFARVGIG